MADDDTDMLATGAALTRSFDEVAQRSRGLERSANGFARTMTAAFAQAATGARRFDDVLKSLALRLSSMAVQLALKPVMQGIASGFGKLLATAFGGGAASAIEPAAKVFPDVQPFARGGVIAAPRLRSVQAFAEGGVLAAPAYFPLAHGLGLAGEAGPEAILPLARGSDGRLGVTAAGRAPAHVTVNIAAPDVESFRRSQTYVTGMLARAVARGQRGL